MHIIRQHNRRGDCRHPGARRTSGIQRSPEVRPSIKGRSRSAHLERIWGAIGSVHVRLSTDCGDVGIMAHRTLDSPGRIGGPRAASWFEARSRRMPRIALVSAGKRVAFQRRLTDGGHRAITLTVHRCRPLIGCAWSEKALGHRVLFSERDHVDDNRQRNHRARFRGIRGHRNHQSQQLGGHHCRCVAGVDQFACAPRSAAGGRHRRSCDQGIDDVVRASMARTPGPVQTCGHFRSIPFRLSATDWRR